MQSRIEIARLPPARAPTRRRYDPIWPLIPKRLSRSIKVKVASTTAAGSVVPTMSKSPKAVMRSTSGIR